MIFGHRGFGTDPNNPPYPENSLESLIRSVQLPHVKGVEFDLSVLKDGSCVIFHDFDYQNIQISELNKSDLPDHVCTFDEFLNAYISLELKEKKGIIIEIKYPPKDSPKYKTFYSREAVVDIVFESLSKIDVEKLFEQGTVSISSFDPDLLVVVKRAMQREAIFRDIRVLFNCWFGHENQPEEHDFAALRNKEPIEALIFAKKELSGVCVVEIDWLIEHERFLEDAKNHSVSVFTYGKKNLDMEIIAKQQEIWRIECVICDRVDLLS
jgi:glycerophosphoryl diester phosphodiesterase